MKIKNQKPSSHLWKRGGRRGQSPLRPSKFKIIFFLLIFSLVLPGFSFAQPQSFQTPETLEEATEMGEKALGTTQEKLPGILEKIWKEDILPIWEKMYNWFLINIWPKIESWFKKEVEPRVKEEVEKRKPIIEEEFKKEKKELKEDVKKELPRVGKSLWERFQELIK